MFYALVHYPNIDVKLINEFRRKYDPHVALINPHITFVFLVPESVGEGNLISHIESILNHWQPFPIRLKGLQKAWDHWLFLILAEGNESVTRLHRELYTGILNAYHRTDIPFIPHLGLGLFAKQHGNYDIRDPQDVSLDVEKYSHALKEAHRLNLDFRCVIDRLHLAKITDDVSQIVWSKEFLLRRNPVRVE
jgi:2'-5' RNA ligase